MGPRAASTITTISSPPLATCLQGVEAKDTFTPPPFDNTFPYNDIIDWHMDHSPNHRYATLTPCDAVEGGKVMADVTYSERESRVNRGQFVLFTRTN